MDNYLQLTIPVISGEQRELLMAELIDIGFDAFEEEDQALKAFVSQTAINQKAVSDILKRHKLSYQFEVLPPKNWNEEWERNFEPVQIGDFCTVRAGFHPSGSQTKHEIVITPKMSFGTGHHATTYLMLAMMSDIDFEDTVVFDYGTGTGILAIMAEKLGANEIVAVDVDEWSIRNARENIEMNNCSKIQLMQSNNIPPGKTFKVILANINRNVIMDSLPAMCKLLEAKGEILLGGLLSADFEQVNAEATASGLYLQKKGEKSGWIALRYQMQR